MRLASYPVEEVRNTDAWVMGQDTADAAFHETLLTMLGDSSPLVRGNAALSLVRFGDASGRAQIVALLQPAVIAAPSAGLITDTDKIGTPIHQGGVIAKLQNGQQNIEVRSPISGRIRTLTVQKGTTSPRERKSQPWRLATSRFGKRCERFTLSANWMICP